MVIRAKVSTSFSDKYKKDFTNCYIQEVINTTTETSAEDVSNATTPAPVVVQVAPIAEPVAIGDAVDSGVPVEAPVE